MFACPASYRYCPMVTTGSIARGCCLAPRTSTLTETIRSPLLAGDLGPIVGVGGVGQVLVLLELLADGVEEVFDLDAFFAELDVAFEGELLGPADDGLDHGTGGEVLEVEDLLVTVGVGDLEEAVFLAE